MDHKPLRIKAEDHEDLKIISACLQDALIPVAGLSYAEKEKKFRALANRFRWEKPKELHEDAPLYERVHSGVVFSHVHKVKRSGFHPHAHAHHILNLLAIEPKESELILHFSGGIKIKLEIEKVLCHVADVQEPWPTRWQPDHEKTAEQGRGTTRPTLHKK